MYKCVRHISAHGDGAPVLDFVILYESQYVTTLLYLLSLAAIGSSFAPAVEAATVAVESAAAAVE